ncbi:hypothetical protein ABG768_008331 [Culter alburnus]|uniref:Uncharacterized protein n=1 Tax=Culter alburnus TaxID=194366 RepID=A0AAW1ZJ65_CULAL
MSASSPSSPSGTERFRPGRRNAEIYRLFGLDNDSRQSTRCGRESEKVKSIGEGEKQRCFPGPSSSLNRFVKTPRLIYAKRSPCRRERASPEHFLSPDPHFDASVRGAQ